MGCLFAVFGVFDLFFLFWLLNSRDTPPPTAVWAVLPPDLDLELAAIEVQQLGMRDVRIFAGPEDAALVARFERAWWRPWQPTPYTSALDAGRSVLRAVDGTAQLDLALQTLRGLGAREVRAI